MSLFDRLIVGTMPFVPKPIVRKVSSRYVAGETLDDALSTVAELNRAGACATLDVLGEFITRVEEADAAADEYVEALDAIAAKGLDSNVSVKLTHLGLLLDEDRCYQNVKRVVEKAAEHGNFVRIDMEDSSVTQRTLDLYRRLRADHDNVGFVLQAYMRRSLGDLVSMREWKPNVRICKGIYIEPREIAYQDREIVRRNFALLVEELMTHEGYVGVATHDELVVFEALRTFHRHSISGDRFEFQMLLGVDLELRDILIRAGHKLRVYVPFGRSWYAYSMRRLKENPKIARYVIQNMFGGS